MKKSILFLAIVVLMSFCVPSFAAPFEINAPQDVIISQTGFYVFSDSANQTLKELLKESGSVAIIIKNFNGKGIKVAPAADNHEIGRKKSVNGDSVIVINYNKKKAKRFGLSLIPKGSVSFNLEIQPFAGRPCPSPVSCQDDCGGNLGKCCEKDSGGNQSKICVQVGLSNCGCGKR